MIKGWFCGIICLVVFINFNAYASKNDEITALKGRDIIWSSPYQRGEDAKLIKVNSIGLGDNFVDDGVVIINDSQYPIDQLFVKNNERYENLAYLLHYNGVGNTFFIHYYDERRLSARDETLRLKSMAQNCIGEYNEGGLSGEKKEALQYEACLDGIFERIVNLFYVHVGLKLRQNYKALSDEVNDFYFNINNPDYCDGRCGTVAQMRAYDKVLEIKKRLIMDMIDNIDVE